MSVLVYHPFRYHHHPPRLPLPPTTATAVTITTTTTIPSQPPTSPLDRRTTTNTTIATNVTNVTGIPLAPPSHQNYNFFNYLMMYYTSSESKNIYSKGQEGGQWRVQHSSDSYPILFFLRPQLGNKHFNSDKCQTLFLQLTLIWCR